MIEHKDITHIGYFFLNKNQELIFLEKLNEKFALKVGEEATKNISPEKLIELSCCSKDEIQDFFKKNYPNIDEIINKIKENLLIDLKKQREDLLTGKQSIE